jgi:general secretion pathway protein D
MAATERGMGRVGTRSGVVGLGTLALLGVAALALSACGTGAAFQNGNKAALRSDWDLAVTYYDQAVRDNPDRADYKIALERAQLAASQGHFEQARDYERKDQLDLALLEYRKVVLFHPANQEARAKIQALEQVIRDRIEASRPRPPVEAMKQKARQQLEEPALNPASRDPVKMLFRNRPLREILEFLRESAGINIAYDSSFQENQPAIDVNLDGVTLEQALFQILMPRGYYYKVLNPRSIIIIQDTPAKRGQYDEQVVRTFYLSNADATKVAALLNTVVMAPQGAQPRFVPNEAGNSITARGTIPLLQMVDRIIAMNDKPRAEVSIDVEILEVNRGRVKQYGLELSAYQIGFTMSPESRPGGTNTDTSFNLNTISGGVSTADFYTSVPSAVIKFLESDSETKVLAKPNLRGSEGEKLNLELGEDIPVPNTTFYNSFGGSGAATSPMTSFTYRTVGIVVIIDKLRVSDEGEVSMRLSVEISAKGPDTNVAGQNLPSFFKRKAESNIRLRDGESNLLAGLLRENERKSLKGFPGILRLPIIKQLFSSNESDILTTDIVMLLTPHIVRTHEMTQKDFEPIAAGTQSNLGATGPPPLTPVPGGTLPPTGVDAGAPPTAAVAPPTAAVAPTPVPGAQPLTPPPAGAPAAAPAQPTPPAPFGAEPARPPVPESVRIAAAVPTGPMTVAGGPYTVPINIAGASRVSTATLALRYNPKVLRVRLVQEGTFMRQGGATVTFAQQVDGSGGRIDITLVRTGDTTGAAGAGMLAAIVFDAVGAGDSALGLGGIVSLVGGSPAPVQFAPAAVTVK